MTRARDLADYIAQGVSTTELDILDGLTTTTAELNIMDGVTATTAEINILDGVTSTAAELNLIDGDTARGTTAVADGDGFLTNDGGTMRMTNVDTLATYMQDKILGGTSIVTVGALDAGSITSGFGNIDSGASTITTTGLISGGSLDIDNVLINGTTIGHTDDTDLITLANGLVTVAGEVSMTTLDIGGTNVTSTAAELNILDGVTSTAAELNILDGVTSTAAELNILDGVTSTAAELNILDGSVAGTIVNSKGVVYSSGGQVNATTLAIAGTAITSTAAELNILDGVTATATELNLIDGVTATTAELNILDGVTSTAAELNILDGVTSTAAELNVLDGVTSTAAELNILDGVTSTAAELNALDGITAVVGELNALDIGSTAVGTAVASKAVILDANKDYTGIRNLTISGELDAATLDVSGNADIDGTLETDNLTVGGAQGTDGQVLTSTGSGVAWEDAAGGAFDLIGNQALSDGSNSTHNFTSLSAYLMVRIIVTGRDDGGGQQALISPGVDGGSGNDPRTSNVEGGVIRGESGGSAAVSDHNTEYLKGYAAADANKGYMLTYDLYNFNKAAQTAFSFQGSSPQSNELVATGGGIIDVAEAYDYVRVTMESPSSTGRIIVLGVKG